MRETAAAPPGPALRILGVRHHGPGSARAVDEALEQMQPDCVLIEGPADADGLLALAADAQMEPPVALLAWERSDPSRSVVWPFTVFSPEWRALTWALRHGVEVRFMDLPSEVVLAQRGAGTGPQPGPPPADEQADVPVEGSGAEQADEQAEGLAVTEATPVPSLRTDPIARLAAVAGHDDPEAWWEDAVELASRRGDDDADIFDDILAAMTALREDVPEADAETLAREAQMRKVLRAARKQHQRIVVVCGAWHGPALAGRLPAATADNALLKPLAKVKTDMTWVPWTHARLATRSGYGAGIDSPGWYHHLFTVADRPVERWLTHVAGVLRDNDLPVSSAHIIEAVRLAESLAVLRGRPMPGLGEVTEATWSVMCEADDLRLDLVTRQAVVGQALGQVPDSAPTVPLDADLRATAKRLRLKFEASEKTVTLDLRKPNDLDKSRLFHRLRVLGITWAHPATVRTTGTFKEGWTLSWEPELALAVIEAARHGNTVEQAAGTALCAGADSLAKITAGIETALVAHLPEVLPRLLDSLDEGAAHEADVVQLLAAVPPLARASRYGDVRGTDTARLAAVCAGILARACVALPVAAAGASEQAAAALRPAVDAVHLAVDLLDEQSVALWTSTLRALVDVRDLPGLLGGRLTRILADGGHLTADETAGRVARALSAGVAAEHQAPWIEGFLSGSPELLLHDLRLLRIVDGWVRGLDEAAFVAALPVVRRAFGGFETGSRRRLADRVASLAGLADEPPAVAEDFTDEDALLATVALLLGAHR